MNDFKQRAAVLITLALVGVLINIVMFKAGIGNWLLLLGTIALAIYSGVALKKAL